MSYFKKLNLPMNPCIDSKAISNLHIIPPFKIMEPEEILTSEVLTIFNEIGIRPKMVVLHGKNDQASRPGGGLIHTDLTFDPVLSSGWRKIIAGVNWEIEGSHCDFFWYDMTSIKECWPEETAPSKVFNGIHYGERRQIGIPETAKILDQTTIYGPTLVRTEIPHTTLYNNPTTTRIGLSVRFFEEDYNYSWDCALEKFSQLIL